MLLENESPASASAPETQPAAAALFSLLFGKHITYSLSAVARLGVPDHMSDGPCPIHQLAEKVGADESSLYRVMRMLAGVGVFEEKDFRTFGLTPIGNLLRTEAAGSIRYFAIQLGDQWSTRAWEHFTDTVRTGEDGVTKAFGENVFQLFSHEPEQSETFNRSMSCLSALMVDSIVKSYDFTGITRMADVGGGQGRLLSSVLQHYPEMKGVVYDLPEVVAGGSAKPHVRECGGRLEFQAGSFFEGVPSGCDAYIMKFILHDWNDAACRQILTLIRERLPVNGRVLICEQVVTSGPAAMMSKLLDIEMLALTVGGRERTAQEFDDLLASAGLRLARVVETDDPLCVLEARLA